MVRGRCNCLHKCAGRGWQHIPETGCPVHFVPRLGDGLSAFERLDQRQLLLLSANQFRSPQKALHAISAGRLRPGSAIKGFRAGYPLNAKR